MRRHLLRNERQEEGLKSEHEGLRSEHEGLSCEAWGVRSDTCSIAGSEMLRPCTGHIQTEPST